MTGKRKTAAALLLILCSISFLHWDVVGASYLSLGAYVLLALRDGLARTSGWDSRILEFWIAAAAWLAAFVACSAALGSRRNFPGLPVRTLSVPRRKAAAVLSLVIGAALCAPFLAPVGPNTQGSLSSARLLPPLSSGTATHEQTQMSPAPGDHLRQVFEMAKRTLLQRSSVTAGPASPSGKTILFLFGTDDTGRDVFSRVLYGTRLSLVIGLLGALGALLIGTAIGLLSGLRLRLSDTLLMRLTDLFLSVPPLILIGVTVAFLGHSVGMLVVILSLTGWMGVARVVRGEMILLRDREFIQALRLLHLPTWRIVAHHMLPHLWPLLLTAAVLQFGNAILAEAALGFLGLGVQPPTPTLGNMMSEAAAHLQTAWWLGIFPGAVLALLLVCSQVVGERGYQRS